MTIPSDVLLGLLSAEATPGLPAGVTRSWNGLILKRQREEGKAEQEFVATQLARFLLPGSLGVPQPWGVIASEYYVSERIDERFNRHDPEQVRMATDYLIELHAVSLDRAGLGAELLRAGFAHYHGEALRARLGDELGRAQAAFAARGLGRELERYAELISATRERWTFDDDIVLGHGDFRAGNLFVRGDAIVPIDWTDVGLCDRAYEVMHFVEGLAGASQAMALARYTTATGSAMEEIRTRGSVVGGILRAGSWARLLELGLKEPEECARKFVEILSKMPREIEGSAGAR